MEKYLSSRDYNIDGWRQIAFGAPLRGGGGGSRQPAEPAVGSQILLWKPCEGHRWLLLEPTTREENRSNRSMEKSWERVRISHQADGPAKYPLFTASIDCATGRLQPLFLFLTLVLIGQFHALCLTVRTDGRQRAHCQTRAGAFFSEFRGI